MTLLTLCMKMHKLKQVDAINRKNLEFIKQWQCVRSTRKFKTQL